MPVSDTTWYSTCPTPTIPDYELHCMLLFDKSGVMYRTGAPGYWPYMAIIQEERIRHGQASQSEAGRFIPPMSGDSDDLRFRLHRSMMARRVLTQCKR